MEEKHVLPLLIMSGFLTFTDWIFTTYELLNGLAIEANPLLSYLFDIHPLYVLLLKVLVYGFSFFAIWKLKDRRSIQTVTLIMFSTFLCVNIYHVYGLTFLV